MTERPDAGDRRRMSDAEALMWILDKDPGLRSTFVGVSLLDRAPDFDRFRRRMEAAVAGLARLRQRVVSPPARLAPPAWADDPSFDLDFHLRRVSLPAPGTDRQLLDLAAGELEDPFDRARPLWRYTVVEGLAGGRAALLTKMHHALADGVRGLRLSTAFLDRDGAGAEPVVPIGAGGAGGGGAGAGGAGGGGAGAGGAGGPVGQEPVAAALLDALAHGLRRPVGAGRSLAGGLAGGLRHPGRLPARARDAAGALRSLAHQLAVTDQGRSPLWAGRRSLRRHLEILSVDLAELKSAANALGGSVNDGFVGAVAGGAGAYHRARGARVDELRMSMALNTGFDDSVTGNAFTPSRTLVPAGAGDPAARFRDVRRRLHSAKRVRGLDLTGALAGVLNTLPTALIVGLARHQVDTLDFVTSNLRGATRPLYVAGAEILATHPMGPTLGTAFNATVLSYRGRLHVGLDVDPAAVDDPALLRDCIAASFHELVALGRR